MATEATPAGELTPRMQLILDAAITVTGRAGLRGLTHRAVDAEAGLAQGSTSAYLRTRQALLEALTHHVAEKHRAAIDQLAEQVRSGVADEVVIDHAIGLFVGWLDEPQLLIARIELDREGLRQPELAALAEPGHERVIATVAEMLERVDCAEPRRKATAIVAALDGVLINAVSRPAGERSEYVREVARTIIVAFVEPRPATS